MTRVSQYRRIFEKAGRRVTLERTVTNAPALSLPNVRARIRGVTPEEIVGGISANGRKVLILAEDVPADWRPLKRGDQVLVDGLRLTFTERPDDQTHRDGDALLAYDGVVSGA